MKVYGHMYEVEWKIVYFIPNYCGTQEITFDQLYTYDGPYLYYQTDTADFRGTK